jgi:hypothetical protein
MRRLATIAFVLVVWAGLATFFLNVRQLVGAPTPDLDRIGRRKVERTNEFFGAVVTVATACVVLPVLVGVGKTVLGLRSMSRRSSRPDSAPGAGVSPPPATERPPDDPAHLTSLVSGENASPKA